MFQKRNETLEPAVRVKHSAWFHHEILQGGKWLLRIYISGKRAAETAYFVFLSGKRQGITPGNIADFFLLGQFK